MDVVSVVAFYISVYENGLNEETADHRGPILAAMGMVAYQASNTELAKTALFKG